MLTFLAVLLIALIAFAQFVRRTSMFFPERYPLGNWDVAGAQDDRTGFIASFPSPRDQTCSSDERPRGEGQGEGQPSRAIVAPHPALSPRVVQRLDRCCGRGEGDVSCSSEPIGMFSLIEAEAVE